MDLEERQKLGEETSMTNWWPVVRDLDVPTPKTVRVEVTEKEVDDGAPATDGTTMVNMADNDEVREAVEEVDGPPAFLRTDQVSEKHSMDRGSRISALEEDEIGMSIGTVFERNKMAMGVPDPMAYYVREWLDLYHEFKAFSGTPIAAELRFYVMDGEIHDYGFYWPKDAIRRPDIDDWKTAHEMTEVRAFEYESTAIKYAKKVAQEFEGYWTVDFAHTFDKEWYCIDMARGKISHHLEGIERPEGL